MALTYTVFWETANPAGTGGDITSSSRTYTLGELIVVVFGTSDNVDAGTLSIANSGTAQSWTPGPVTNTASNTKIAMWFCTMSLTQAMTVTIAGNGTGTSIASVIGIIECVGEDPTNPVPADKRFSGAAGTDITQIINPSAIGSDLWMLAADWTAGNTFAAAANCTLEDTFQASALATFALIRPTTQPRTDMNAFTIGETDTGGTIAWVAFEVQAEAPVGPDTPIDPAVLV